MYSVKIYGAGSIGNHLANAFRSKDFDVVLSDIDPAALDRAKNLIYPQRYGIWDSKIDLQNAKEIENLKTDIVFIGTPPEHHISIALKELENNPKVILIEKPLCEPAMKDLDLLFEASKNTNTKILVGYNHVVSKAAQELNKYLSTDYLGEIQTISSYTREHWGGIFNAHPWLDGPKDSYLGYSAKGGGALCEHSHGLNFWQHLSNQLNLGRIEEVSAELFSFKNEKVDYDKLVIASLKTESGHYGDLIQDVVTFPTIKKSKVQGDKRFAEIEINVNNTDIVTTGGINETPSKELIKKTRPDDFIWEVEHIISLIKGEITDSPIALIRGIETMCVIEAIFRSSKERKPVKVAWKK